MVQSIWWSEQCLLHEQVSVSFDKREVLCILMQYDIELMHTFGIKALKFILYTIFFYHFDYDVETWYWSAFFSLQWIHFNANDSLEQTWSL